MTKALHHEDVWIRGGTDPHINLAPAALPTL